MFNLFIRCRKKKNPLEQNEMEIYDVMRLVCDGYSGMRLCLDIEKIKHNYGKEVENKYE